MLLDRRPVLLLVGQPGSSRSRLADAVAGPGPRPAHHVCRHGDSRTPWLAVESLLPGLVLSPETDERAAEEAVRAAVTQLPGGRPTVVLANAHFCDPESLMALTRVAATGELRVIATLTPDTVVRQPHLLSLAEVLELLPLDEPTIAALLQARFGATPHRALVSLLRQRIGGSYAELRTLCDAGHAAGMLVLLEGVLVINPHYTDDMANQIMRRWDPAVGERLGSDPGMTELLHLTALLGELDLAEARHHLDGNAIDLAVAEGTLRAADDALTFTSSAVGTQVRLTMPTPQQRELFDRWSGLLSASLERPRVALLAAEWWLTVGQLLPLPLANRAARQANLSGRHHRALVLTDPASNEKGVLAAPLERAFALHELGEADELDAMFATCDPQQLTEDELLPYLRWVARLSTATTRDPLVTHALLADDAAEARRRSAVNTLATLLERGKVEAGDELTSQLRALTFSAQLSPRNRAVAFAALSSVQRQSGQPDRAVESAEFALRLLVEDPEELSAFHLDPAREHHIVALLDALDLEGVERAIDEYSSGDLGGSGRMTSALRCAVELQQGRVQEALVDARLCLAALPPRDPHHIRGAIEAILAQILVQCGRPAEAREMLEQSATHPAALLQRDLERRIAQATVLDGLAEPEEALTLLATVAEEARSHRLRPAEIDACVLSVQISGPPHLQRLLEAVEGLDETGGTPAVWQTFARAADSYDIPALVSLAQRLEHRGARLLAAEVAQYVLDMARRASDLDPVTRTRLQRLADPVSHRHIEPT